MTEDAFLEDIRENPDEDTPRLIFADWLQERGQKGDEDRADFIRLQCERARMEPGDDREKALRQRVEQLLHAHWEDWVCPLARILADSTKQDYWLSGGFHPEAVQKFRRGFIWMLGVDADHFLNRARDILRLAPVEHLRLFQAGGLGRQLAGCVELGWLRRLDFADYWIAPLEAPDMEALAGSANLGRLRALSVYRNDLADAGTEALAEANWLGNIETLELGDNGLTARGISALAGTSQPFRPLRLRLGANPIGDDGVIALIHSPIASRLRSLALDGCRMGPAGLTALVRSPYLRELQLLDVEGNELGGNADFLLRELQTRQPISIRYSRSNG